MDHDLQGEKGELKLYVNNVGKVIETVKGKDPEAGNRSSDLTIDEIFKKQLIIFWNKN